MPLILPGNVASATASTTYDVANSCRFNDNDTAYMHKTFGAGGATKKWTFSTWFKRGNLGISNPQNLFGGEDSASRYTDIMVGTPSGADDTLWWKQDTGTVAELRTTQKLRDPAAWYHIVFAYDSAQATASDRNKMYLNGVRITDFVTETNVAQDVDSYVCSDGDKAYVGTYDAGSKWLDGYMAETILIDNQALTPTSFGEFNEDSPTIWQPIDISGLSVGSQGFYLDFKDSANLGNDASGGTDFTEVNLDATDQATDTPTNNFCTMNPLTGSAVTYTEGNCVTDFAGMNNWKNGALATMGVSAGKWYWEAKIITGTTTNGTGVIRDTDTNYASGRSEVAIYNQNINAIQADRYIYKQDDANDSSTFTAFADDEIISIALDMDNKKMWFAKDGDFAADSSTGDPAAGSNEHVDSSNFTAGAHYIPFNFGNDVGANPVLAMNFGGCPGFAISSGNTDENGYGNFEYSVPSGFLALCTKNLAEYG
jgi:hypothetical protein